MGNIKDKLGSHIRVKNEQLAKIYGLIRMLIYNIYVYIRLIRKKKFFVLYLFIIFRRNRQ